VPSSVFSGSVLTFRTNHVRPNCSLGLQAGGRIAPRPFSATLNCRKKTRNLSCCPLYSVVTDLTGNTIPDMNVAISLELTPFSQHMKWPFGGMFTLHLQGKKQACSRWLRTSETSVHVRTTRRYIPEGGNIYIYRCENHRSNTVPKMSSAGASCGYRSDRVGNTMPRLPFHSHYLSVAVVILNRRLCIAPDSGQVVA
jgi:hypothetical protein